MKQLNIQKIKSSSTISINIEALLKKYIGWPDGNETDVLPETARNPSTRRYFN